MTTEEKLQLNRDRQKAVRDAWAREKNLVMQGKGTVNWTMSQQKELIETGRVNGYEGHHMKSVYEYPEHAGNKDNIQMLKYEDHVAAHNAGRINDSRGFRSPTNGYYNPETKRLSDFGNNPPRAPKVHMLSSSYCKENERTTGQYCSAKSCEKAQGKSNGKSYSAMGKTEAEKTAANKAMINKSAAMRMRGW